MSGFLLKEYEECFAQLRFYDDRQLSLLKFSIAVSSSVAAGISALYRIFKIADGFFWLSVALICGVVSVGLFLIFVSMIQNRLYYIYPTRQVNALRKFLIESENREFLKHNQMYVKTDFSAFKWRSTQTLMIGGVAFLNSLSFGFAVFSNFKFLQIDFMNSVAIGILAGITFFAVIVFSGGKYLIEASRQRADKSVHENG